MRPSTALILAVLPLVLAHTPPLERRARHHAEMERQLLGRPTDEDIDTATSTPVNTVAPLRSSTTAVPQTTSAITPSARATTPRSSIVGTSAVDTSVPITDPRVSSTSTSSGTAVPSSVSGTTTGSLSSNATSASSTSASASSSAPSSSAPASAIIHTSVDAGGNVVVVTQYYTPSAISPSPAPAAATSPVPEKSDAPAISVPAIIGISVAVGVVILGLIGCAVWRMKRRGSDEDEAIRWPELNRHGDSATHHALPARATGKHGIETDALERSLSNSSEVYMSQNPARPPSMPMALGGSNFGAASALDYYDKEAPTAGYDHGYPSYHADSTPHAQDGAYDHEDYANLPPPLSAQPAQTGAGTGMYESDSDGEHGTKVAPPVYR